MNRSRKIRVWSEPDRRVVFILVSVPSAYQKRKLRTTFAFIEQRLTDEEFRNPIRQAIQNATFLTTKSRHVGAQCLPKRSTIVLNTLAFRSPEFCVTVLHELLHIVIGMVTVDHESWYEAVHDLATYALLGLPVPSDHWAFHKFPQIREATVDDVCLKCRLRQMQVSLAL